MWTESKASNITKNKKELPGTSQKSFNVNGEYLCTLRTKSCAEFFSKAQALIKDSSPSKSSYASKFSETILLEPRQEAIPSILESPFLTKFHELKGLLNQYFDISAEASQFCTNLLQNIKETQSITRLVQQLLDSIANDPTLIVSELALLLDSNNLFPDPQNLDFKLIQHHYTSIFSRLNRLRKKVARKIRFIKIIKKVSGICVIGPTLFSFPLKTFREKLRRRRLFNYGVLRKIGEKIDAAAKGTYILNRDFDTLSRLVVRIDDAIEHSKAMVRLCLMKEERFAVHVVDELKRSNLRIRKQIEELEEHLFLCLVTINRSRALVISSGSVG